MLGSVVLVARLALRDLRRRPAPAIMLLILIAVTTTTLTAALAMGGATDQPFKRTRAATSGPDAVANLLAGEPGTLAALAHAPGVTATAGPYPLIHITDLHVRDLSVAANVQGRDTSPGPIDRPLITDGTWVRDGGAVIESAFAHALSVRPGDAISVGALQFRVDGIAISAAQAPYPLDKSGLVWLTRHDQARVAATAGKSAKSWREQQLYLRLAASSASDFAGAHSQNAGSGGIYVQAWPQIGDEVAQGLADQRTALLGGTVLLALLAAASVALLVGGRMAEQTRRVGLLKAIGTTPRLAAVVLLAEHLPITAVAAIVGLITGRLAAPLLIHSTTGLIGTIHPPALPVTHAAAVLLVAVIITATATVVPAIRGARTSTLRALTGPTRQPRRSGLLIAASAHLPVPLLLGVRLAARRPRRTLLTAMSTCVTTTAVVAAVTLRHGVANKAAHLSGRKFVAGVHNPITDLVDQTATVMMIALLALAAVNAILTAWATTIDTRRSAALTSALGATPTQAAAGVSTSQLLPALAATLLGTPLGVLIAQSAQANSTTSPPFTWLTAIAPTILIAVALLAGIPAAIAARRPPADTLRDG